MIPCTSLLAAPSIRHRRRAHGSDAALLTALGFFVMTLLAPLAALAQEGEGLAPPPSAMAPLAERSLLLDVALAGTRLVAVGERGHILLSDDNGRTWRQVPSPASVTLTAVHFGPGDVGWAVGHDAAILRSDDAGLSWELVRWAPEDESPLLDVWFADADHGFAIGAYGTFLETSDGGDSWEERWISDADLHLHHLARSSRGQLFIAAEAGAVYRSDDGGAEWNELPSPYEGSFFGTLPIDDDLLVFGLRGHAYRSGNGGETWDEVETGTQAMLTAAIELADARVVVVGLIGSVLISSDRGRTFELRAQPDRLGISSIVQASDGALVLAGEGGVRRIELESVEAAEPRGGQR